MLLGMTGMVGSAGLLKGYHRARAVSAPAVRVDDVVRSDICLFKADVEGPGFEFGAESKGASCPHEAVSEP